MTFFTREQLQQVDLLVEAVYAGYKTDRGGVADPVVSLTG